MVPANSLANASAAEFGAALLTATVRFVGGNQSEDGAAVELATVEETKVEMSTGNLDLSLDGMLDALLAETQRAVCTSLDDGAQCTVTVDETAEVTAISAANATNATRRQLQSGAGGDAVTLLISRSYDFAASDNSTTPIADLIEGAFEAQNVTVGSTELLALSMTVLVTVPGDAESSAVDDNFDSAVIETEVATQLPSMGVTVTNAVVVTPPLPPPARPSPLPPIPSNPPAPPMAPNVTSTDGPPLDEELNDAILTAGAILGVVVVLVVIACVGALLFYGRIPKPPAAKVTSAVRVGPFVRSAASTSDGVQEIPEGAIAPPTSRAQTPDAVDQAAYFVMSQSRQAMMSQLAGARGLSSGHQSQDMHLSAVDLDETKHAALAAAPQPVVSRVPIVPPRRPPGAAPRTAPVLSPSEVGSRWQKAAVKLSMTYISPKRETIADIAKMIDVPVADLIRWNSDRFKNLAPDSIAVYGTKLVYADPKKAESAAQF